MNPSKMKKRGRRSSPLKLFLLFGAFLTFILILIVSLVGRQEFGSSHKFSLELIGPVQGVISKFSTYCQSVKQDYLSLLDAREENKKLWKKLQEARAVNNEYREAVAVNVRLRKLLNFKEALPLPTLTAAIIGQDPSLWFRTVIVDRGSSDGVLKGMPVANEDGVVGQVLNTSPNYAKILLATDPNSAIDALIQRTRTRGIIKGQGDESYQMYYVLKNAEVQKGDRVITSELGGVFPKGLLVGTVSKIVNEKGGMFKQIEVKPATDFSRLENLIIIMKKNFLFDQSTDS